MKHYFSIASKSKGLDILDIRFGTINLDVQYMNKAIVETVLDNEFKRNTKSSKGKRRKEKRKKKESSKRKILQPCTISTFAATTVKRSLPQRPSEPSIRLIGTEFLRILKSNLNSKKLRYKVAEFFICLTL